MFEITEVHIFWVLVNKSLFFFSAAVSTKGLNEEKGVRGVKQKQFHCINRKKKSLSQRPISTRSSATLLDPATSSLCLIRQPVAPST